MKDNGWKKLSLRKQKGARDRDKEKKEKNLDKGNKIFQIIKVDLPPASSASYHVERT